MEATRYSIKFIGDRNVTLAGAYNECAVETLKTNQFEETTENFYKWAQLQTSPIS